MAESSHRQPHRAQPVLTAGRPLDRAHLAVILVHGRGDSARGILELARALHHPEAAYLAPQAANNTWYPQSFLAPIEDNEPHLGSALDVVGGVVDRVTHAGLDPARIVVAGFSQGACLACEFTARNARRYGGLIAFSGGLIGPAGTRRDYAGSLEGTPVFLGCSDRDPHIPRERVDETSDVLAGLGAEVTKRIYPGMGHTIVADEIEHGRAVIRAAAGGAG